MFLYGLIISFFAFLLEIWPRLINTYFGIDTWRHLMYADYIRKNKKLPRIITDRYLVSAQNGYPPVILLFLALFPKFFCDRYQFIFSPMFDFLHKYLIFLATFFLTHNLVSAIVAQIIAVLVPVVVIEASNLNTRILSHLIFTSSFFPLLLFTTTGNYVWLGIAFGMLFLLFFTHKFALQMYFFAVVGFSIIERTPFYIAFFLFTLAVVFLFGGSTYKAIFDDHIGILNFWRKNYMLRFAHQFRGIPKQENYYDFVQKAYMLSVKSPLIFIFGNNPWIGPFILVLIAQYLHFFPNLLFENPILIKLVIWFLLSLAAAVLILSFKKLHFLGEGHRYLEYGIFPLSVILGICFAYLFNLALFFIIAFFVFVGLLFMGVIYIQKKTVVNDRTRTITSPIWEIINILNKSDGERVRLVVFPFTLVDALVYFLKGRVLATDSGKGLSLLKDIFPILRVPLKEIIRKYRLNYILFDENYVKLAELKLEEYKVVVHKEGYYLLKV